MSAQVSSIPQALVTLLSRAIDYAGVFPPSALPLSEALENFGRHIRGEESWAVGSIVLPIALLTGGNVELDNAACWLTAIPRRNAEPAIWRAELAEDIAQLHLFLDPHPSVKLQALEVALPNWGGEPQELFRELIPLVDGHRVFFEVAPGDDFLPRLRGTIIALAEHRDRQWGIKFRAGGVVPEAFPTVATVAEAIATARDCAVPIKFTAGLHHPLRHWNQEIGTSMHGFINVLMAALLAHAFRLPRANIEAILQDERSSSFVFDDRTARWLDLPLRIELIENLRRLVVGFGSCSVDEPFGDLKRLGWLARQTPRTPVTP